MSKTCIHFNGFTRKQRSARIYCKANRSYRKLVGVTTWYDGCALRLPCQGLTGPNVVHCSAYQPKPPEDAPHVEFDPRISACCKAPIDTTHVIKTGRYRGHGRYYCSKCKELCYVV